MSGLPDAICNKCCKAASLMCQRCHETYCSIDCQIIDWKDHKVTCHQMPNLIPLRKFQLHGTPLTNRSTIINDSMQSDVIQPMRRPHNNMHNNDMRRPLENSRRHRDSGSSDGGHHKRNLAHNPLPTDNTDYDGCKSSTLLDEKAFVLKPKVNADCSTSSSKGAIPKSSNSTISERNVEKTIPAWTIPFPPPVGIYFDAIVQFIEEDPSFVWVTELKNDTSLRKLLLEINRNIVNEPPCPVEEIQIGGLVSAPLDKIYYRAEILECSANSKLATVHLIDYGNQLQLQYSQLRSPIPIMRNLNAFAFRIRMPKDSDTAPQTLELESMITIRLLSSNTLKYPGLYDIEFKPKSVPLNLPMQIISSNPEVKIKKVFLGGKHALLQYVNKNKQETDMNFFLNSEHGLKLDFGQSPAEGAFVAARTSQGWRRACLLGCWDRKHIYLVYIIDEGRVGLCSQLKKIPTEYLEQPMRIFAITVTSPNMSLNESLLINVKNFKLQMLAATTPPSKGVNSLPCALYGDEKKITDVLASTYTGILSELGLKCWTERIIDGTIVYITHVITHAEIFISSACSKEYPNIFSSIANNCPPYKKGEEIANGDIVLAALDVSSVYFRAKILSTDKDENNFKVLDIDTGLNCSVTRNNIRKPNLFIRSCPVYVQKVKIAYIEKIPTTITENKALETLEECQANTVEFVIKYEACGDNDTVDLLFKTDEKQSLSKQLLPLIFQPGSNKKYIGSVNSNLTKARQPVAEDTPLPPSPPDTPIIKEAPVNINTAIASLNAMTVDKKLPNLDAKNLIEEADKKVFLLSDLEIIPIPEGETVKLLVLDVISITEGYITACDYGNKEFLKKLCDYTTMVSNHCKCSHVKKDYEPKPNEICLSIFADDGEWYRALCIHVTKDGKYSMMFLDYGNTCIVSKQDILKIPEDLMFPSNANICYIENLPENLSKEQLEKFVAATANGVITCKVRKLEDDTYTIKIHDIEKLFA